MGLFDKLFGNKSSDDVNKLSDNPDERYKQVMRLNDNEKLEEISKTDSELKIKSLALLKLENDPSLLALLNPSSNVHERRMALEVVNNKVVNGKQRLAPVITYVSMYDHNPEVKARAEYYYNRLAAFSSFGTVINIR